MSGPTICCGSGIITAPTMDSGFDPFSIAPPQVSILPQSRDKHGSDIGEPPHPSVVDLQVYSTAKTFTEEDSQIYDHIQVCDVCLGMVCEMIRLRLATYPNA